MCTEKCKICGNAATMIPLQGKAEGRPYLYCKKCEFISTNLKELSTGEAFADRVGTYWKKGREYAMFLNCININRRIKKVLIYGAGYSLSHFHIRKDYAVSVAISDLENFQDSIHFIKEPLKGEYDLIIASEVCEHFENPTSDFRQVLSCLNKDGIAIFSTNINDAKDKISGHLYPFVPSHVSYYSPKSIAHLAGELGFRFFFSTLFDSAPPVLGQRKKYVYFFSRADYADKFLLCGAENRCAYSEYSKFPRP